MLMDTNHQPNFDFIMNPSKGGKGSGFNATSKMRRIIIFIGGVILLLILTLVVSGLVKKNANKAGNSVVDLASYQIELKRIIALGKEKTRDSGLRNKALTASYTLESDYQLTLKILSSRGIKPSKDFATKYAGKQTDELLDSADKSNNFDTKYDEIYKEKLTKYKTKLSEVYPLLKPAEQKIVKAQSDNAKILLGETVATKN